MLPSGKARSSEARERQMRTLNRALAKVRGWLKTGKDRLGVSGKAVKSNITDPESAKMKTSKGVIQGYDGMAVVDAKHQNRGARARRSGKARSTICLCRCSSARELQSAGTR